jgi:cellulose synthase operon protein C
MRSRTIIGLTLFVAGTITASLFLIPSHEEIALMKMKNADFGDAFQRYSTLQSRGDTSINVLVPLIRLHLLYGDIDQAIGLLEDFVAKNPKSVEGRRQLARLYRASQRFHNYAYQLEALQELSPSAADLRELASMYEFLGRHKEQMGALARLVAHRDYYPREPDYMKLATLYRANQQSEDAIAAMLGVINRKEYDVQVDTLHLASHLLLEKGDESRALELVSHYLPNRQVQDAIVLASLFQQFGRYDSAYGLLTPYLPEINHSPELLTLVVELHLARGHAQEAYALLHQRFAEGALPPPLIVTLNDLAARNKDYALVETILQTAPLKTMPSDALLRYADLTFHMKRPDLAALMQKRLGKDYLEDALLLAAVLEIHARDTPKALTTLLAMQKDAIVTTEQKLIVGSIYLRHGHAGEALEMVDSLPLSNVLTTLDAVEFAELYLATGIPQTGLERLDAMPENAPEKLRASAEQARLLLAVGQGKTDVAQQWLKTHTANDSAMLSEAYDMAMRHRQPALAALFAKHIYDRTPTAQTRLQLAETLLLNNRYGEALAHLQPMSRGNKQARRLYLDTLAEWVRRTKGEPDNPERAAALESFLASAIQNTDMSIDEKRNLGYLLAEAGFRDQAEEIFMTLAYNQSFDSPDVDELLGFWGKTLSPAALEWIENRAHMAYGPEKAAWLGHLNDAGYPESVLAVLEENPEELETPLADQYIQALAATHNKKRLRIALAREIARESNTDRLKKLTVIARNEDLSGLAAQGWQKIYTLKPQNAEAAKELGMLAFAANRYSEAQKYLEQYLKQNKADYRVNYAYGEILNRKQKKGQARFYYQQAHEQLAEMKHKDLPALLDEAHLLYRNNRVQESMNLYRRLLSKFPSNKTLRADFAEVLIETKQYEEASNVLSQ